MTNYDKMLLYIWDYIHENGRYPTYREIGDLLGISKQGVARYVDQLIKREVLIKVEKRHRCIRLTRKGNLLVKTLKK